MSITLCKCDVRGYWGMCLSAPTRCLLEHCNLYMKQYPMSCTEWALRTHFLNWTTPELVLPDILSTFSSKSPAFLPMGILNT